jgi:hypothetical protein
VTALAGGAAAALKPTVEQAIKDGYSALKTLIKGKYTQVNVDVLEQDPASESRRTMVKEDLAKTKAATDAELLIQSRNCSTRSREAGRGSVAVRAASAA